MSTVLIDSNVLLDVLTNDPAWGERSANALAACAGSHLLAINSVIYAEVSVGFKRIEDVEAALPHAMFVRLQIPWEAAFLAGKCFLRYRRRGGTRTTPLPDFFIGAHAAVENLALLTRDVARYEPYFPRVALIVP